MRTALVVVSSTRAAAGDYPDRSGPVLVSWLRSRGFDVPEATVVSDAELTHVLSGILGDRPGLPSVLLTSGGTGLSDDDRTIDVIAPHLDREIPGIAHAFWSHGMQQLSTAVLSRTLAGVIGTTFIMAVPGSVGAARDATAVLDPLLDHILAILGGDHDH
ncbi:MogA/MoaB family molybdenum cofactor biosynthesis protein [Corynebacterium pacaense]|uniref:MogA/MoaB family molybdenum cofactor biosynthesis protein n=1 Tax=Corynebacterium pacaense TaxID=1816684 RepID=UPI0009BBB2BE|nr:MogA/MoaB family molybdenum cofactor biosynthesis protein [Corynebacterium pacaense]